MFMNRLVKIIHTGIFLFVMSNYFIYCMKVMKFCYRILHWEQYVVYVRNKKPITAITTKVIDQ